MDTPDKGSGPPGAGVSQSVDSEIARGRTPDPEASERALDADTYDRPSSGVGADSASRCTPACDRSGGAGGRVHRGAARFSDRDREPVDRREPRTSAGAVRTCGARM